MANLRTYSDLIKLPSFEERFNYLRTMSRVSDVTFGTKRYLNQIFYRSDEWRKIRDYVIIRDGAYDLGIREDIHLLNHGIVIHHMNPLTENDIVNQTDFLIDPEFLITTFEKTHKAIHYGDENTLKAFKLAERSPNDTCLWRR